MISPKNASERYELFAESRLPIDLEPRTYTTEEFVSKIRERDHFAVESLILGVPLYGEQLFQNLEDWFRKRSREAVNRPND